MDSVDSKVLRQRAASKRWRDKNKRKVALRAKAYRAKNLEKLRAAGWAWGKKNYWSDVQAAAKRNRQQRQKHRDNRIAGDRAYYQENAEARCAYSRRWYEEHKSDPAYRVRKRKNWVAYQQRRRALKQGAAVNLAKITEWMQSVKAKPTAICYHCKTRVPSSSVHFDHIIPLSKGGPHSIENLCVSCEPCNRSKGAKPLRVWIRTGQQILEL